VKHPKYIQSTERDMLVKYLRGALTVDKKKYNNQGNKQHPEVSLINTPREVTLPPDPLQ
jgi:hypothetical protein